MCLHHTSTWKMILMKIRTIKNKLNKWRASFMRKKTLKFKEKKKNLSN